MRRKKRIITVAIDSPAAAGAGTQAKYIAKEYNLLYLDTGKIYRYIGRIKLKEKKNFSYNSIKQKINNLKLKSLDSKSLLTNEIANSASIVAKDYIVKVQAFLWMPLAIL